MLNLLESSSMMLLRKLAEHARDRPHDIAFAECQADATLGRILTYRCLAEAISCQCERLQTVLAKSDAGNASESTGADARSMVLLRCPNRIEFPVMFLAILAAGHDVFSIPAEATSAEVERLAMRCGATAIFSDRHFSHHAAPDRLAFFPIDDALSISRPLIHEGAAYSVPAGKLLLQSSGTTGLPRIAVRNAASLDAVAEATARAVDLRVGDSVLAVIPINHSYGIEHALLAPIWAGARVLLCNGLDLPTLLPHLQHSHITHLPGVPSMYELLAELPDRLALTSLRAAYSAGAPLPGKVYESFLAKHQLRIGQLYGATEIGSVLFSDPHHDRFNAQSVGRPMQGVDIRLLDRELAPSRGDCEIAVRSASMLEGYLDEQTPLTEGYFRTGDLGHFDECGNLVLTGRLKLLIDVGGMKVNPMEVESAMLGHPGVGACVVMPVVQSETIQRIKAIVTPRAGAPAPSQASLRQFARAQLASYKVPRIFEIRETLPRSASGKILRHLVQA